MSALEYMPYQPQTSSSHSLGEDTANNDFYNSYVGTGVAHKPPPNLHFRKSIHTEERKLTSILRVDGPNMSQQEVNEKQRIIDPELNSIDVITGVCVTEVKGSSIENEIVEDSQAPFDKDVMEVNMEDEEVIPLENMHFSQSPKSSQMSKPCKSEIQKSPRKFQQSSEKLVGSPLQARVDVPVEEAPSHFHQEEKSTMKVAEIEDDLGLQSMNSTQVSRSLRSPSPKRAKNEVYMNEGNAKPTDYIPIYKRQNVDSSAAKHEQEKSPLEISKNVSVSPRIVRPTPSAIYKQTPSVSPQNIKGSQKISSTYPTPESKSEKTNESTIEKVNLDSSDALDNLLNEYGDLKTCFDPKLGDNNQNDFVMTTIPGIERIRKRFPQLSMTQKWFCRDCCSKDDTIVVCMDYVRLFDVYKSQYTNGFVVFETLINDLSGIDLTKRKRLYALRKYFNMKEEIGEGFSTLELFLFIVKLAEMAEKLLPKDIPYMACGFDGSVTLSQKQCAVILANMFLGICDDDDSFYFMLSSTSPVGYEKVRFMMAYFESLKTSMPEGNISFRRTSIKEKMDIRKITTKIRTIEIHVSTSLRIEEAAGCSQMDFANKYIGGGVLGNGAVQEEIRFLMCPEMIVSLILFEKMEETEAITIVGAQTYSSYTGYADKLQWSKLRKADAALNRNRDEYGRIVNELIAVDALHFKGNRSSQFLNTKIDREIFKLLAGFAPAASFCGSSPPISTGWWGCGAFGGDKQLKSMLQVVAATITGRPLIFCTFGEEKMAMRLHNILAMLKKNNLSVASLYSLIVNYRNWPESSKSSLFDYISYRIKARFPTST